MNAEFAQTTSVLPPGSLPIPAGDIPHVLEKSAKPRVLVVDDESLVRWAIRETLSDAGYEVVEANDAESAIRELFFEDRRPDLVMLDLQLPDSSDLGVLSFLRRTAPDTPVILMSAYGTPDLFEQAERLGARVLSKPFETVDLVPLVGRTLDGRLY